MISRAVGVVAGLLTLTCVAAEAQTMSAYRVGLGIAQQRGYANAGCYAEVFARHAVVVERSDGRRGWNAASTPAYNAEQRRRCGIDRLGDLARRRDDLRPAVRPSAGSITGGGDAYRHGVRIAVQRGYHGRQAHCFGAVFKTHAVLQPSPFRNGVVDWSASISNAMRGEMYSQCGIQM